MRVKDTAEVRWFMPGEPPETAAAWIAALGAGAEQTRTDRYLPPSGPDRSVKHREGRIEIKRRLAVIGERTVGPERIGYVERWQKWVLPAEAAGAFRSDGPHIELWKGRRLAALTYDGGEIRKTERQPGPEGCDVELTRLRLNDAPFWTVCFEAYGSPERLENILYAATAFAFDTAEPPRLAAGTSAGYPDWLLANSPVSLD